MPRIAKQSSPPSGNADEIARLASSRPLRVEAVLRSAEKAGLLLEKNGRIAGRVNLELVKRAKARTGIKSDSELLAFALANVALDDGFAEAFASVAGTVDPALDLEF